MVGTWDVDAMLADMPAKVFAEWEQFFQLEPWGAMVEELRIGQQCALLANINSTKSRFKPEDFLTTVTYKKPEQTPEEMLAVLRGMVRAK